MSDARVTFGKLNSLPSEAGLAQWGWSNPNDRSAPTFTPSVNCGTCGWHGYIERGRCVSVAKKDEPEPAPR